MVLYDNSSINLINSEITGKKAKENEPNTQAHAFSNLFIL